LFRPTPVKSQQRYVPFAVRCCIRPDLKKLAAAFYRTSAGTEPVRDWLKSLSPDERREIGQDIATVEYGWPVGMPLCRPLRQGLWEVRSDLPGNRTARVIFCVAQGQMVLLHGFIKKTQKIPDEDLVLARKTHEGDRVMSKRTPKKASVGTSFDDFLKQEGTYEATQAVAIKRVLAWQIEKAMKKQHLTKAEMARRMETSRSQLDRLLDPDSDSVTLETLTRAARAIGRQVKLELV
jgi:phage-related protein/predicted XRE-type DNA-binding protein